MPASITASEALRLLLSQPERVRAVDVRSGGEFATASVPGFVNLPILTNEERHEVGTRYKQKGQAEAIELGQGLVGPYRDSRISGWKNALEGAEFPLVTCFRGGMRSGFACDWLKSAGVPAIRIEGGYKALRHELLVKFESLPELLVVAGPTGSGKTRLLKEALVPHLDLEKLANHKGSAFGGSLLAPQPAQATFENYVGFSLLGLPEKILIEDESAMVGKICLPEPLRKKITGSKVIRIRMSAEERAAHIFQEYVTEPLAQGTGAAAVKNHYCQALSRIEKKLGGLATSSLKGKLEIAFASGDRELHLGWISELLHLYYDKAYEYSFQKIPRETAFEGDWESCKQWIQEKFR
jgi:tRNA 2-selenouridine synthase